MKTRTIAIALLFVAGHTCCVAATRVALVSTCGGDAAADLIALAEAKLSAEPVVELVERREVERVLREQRLLACGLSHADHAVAVGRLLGAEVFASLETIPTEKNALGLVVFDARSGVKLWDSVLPAGGKERAADGIVWAVLNANDKRQRMPAGVRTVCVLSVRNADLPRELDSFCESLGLLLDRQLLNSPSLAVLERRRLEHVNRERALPLDAPAGDLFPSLVVLDLELSRGETPAEIKATALLSDGKGNHLGKVEAKAHNRNLMDLSQSLLATLTTALNAAPVSVVGDRVREAERFEREARFLQDGF